MSCCIWQRATVLLASLVAMRKDNLKARLAYSTVSQLGYISIGALLATQAGAVGGGDAYRHARVRENNPVFSAPVR